MNLNLVRMETVLPILFLLCFAAFCGGKERNEVINAGVPGNNSRNLLARLDADVLNRNPALVIVGIGTNDAINSKNSVPLPAFKENLALLTRRIRAAGAKVIFLTPPPCHDPFVLERHAAAFFKKESPSAKLLEYRNAVLRFCEANRVPVVDLYGLFQKDGNVGELEKSWIRNERNSGAKDGVHPTPTGYRAIAEAAAAAVRQSPPLPGGCIVCFGDSITFGSGAKGAGTVTGESYPAILRLALAPGN